MLVTVVISYVHLSLITLEINLENPFVAFIYIHTVTLMQIGTFRLIFTFSELLASCRMWLGDGSHVIHMSHLMF